MDKKIIFQNIFLASIWIALATLCVYLYPRDNFAFKYQYEVGKPWAYDALIADEAFPIYKTETQLQNEQEEVLRTFTPYYHIDETLASKLTIKVLNLPAADNLSRRATDYLKQEIQSIYAIGVLSATDAEHIQVYSKISLINNQREARAIQPSQCFTPRSAYSHIMEHAPFLTTNDLRALELDKYIIPNLHYDSITSANVRKELLSSVADTQGMVEAGVKIIDKGDIVTEDIAQKLNSLRIIYQDAQADQKQQIFALVGNSVLVILFLSLLLLYLAIFRRHLLLHKRYTIFFALLIACMISLTYVTLKYTTLSIYIIPFAWVPILVRVFIDSRTAYMVHLSTVLLATFMTARPIEFLIVQILIGLVTVSSLQEMTARAQLVRTAGMVLVTMAVSYSAYILATTGDPTMLEWKQYIYFALNALFITFAYALIFFCEKGFGFMSAVTLVELTNANSSLMMEFAGKAPGTFQHSLQVSDLATEAARKIGANTLLVRTGALYHDIGKMVAPQNFIENQHDGYNPLSDLSYEEAAKVIIQHVEEGVRIAKKHKLPELIVRFIQTHHGTSKTRYFYNSYKNAHPDEVIDESIFTYPGPRPSSKEGAILMMADAVEARSRSMSVYTEENIAEMIEQMIDAQIADGQFKDTILSFKDVEDIKAVFREKLINMNHHRIVYPEIQEEAKEPSEA